MGGIKTSYSVELNNDQITWLKQMTDKYSIEDEGKALRIILDFVQEEADLDTVFEEVRCGHCG